MLTNIKIVIRGLRVLLQGLLALLILWTIVMAMVGPFIYFLDRHNYIAAAVSAFICIMLPICFVLGLCVDEVQK